jgi:hypothetical protein
MILSWLWRRACGDVGEGGALQNTFAADVHQVFAAGSYLNGSSSISMQISRKRGGVQQYAIVADVSN